MRLTKSYAAHTEIKDAEQGVAELVVACYGNLDFDGDVVLKGASAKQIAGEYGPNPKGMLDHDWAMRSAVAKTLQMWEEDDGLHIEAQFNLNKQVGREAFDDLKFYGEDCQFSVGYEIKEFERAGQDDRDKGIRRYIKTWVINEWSFVMLGANDQTHLVSLKGRRESKAIVGSYELLTQRICEELNAAYPSSYLWVHGTFPDHVVFDREMETMDGYSHATYQVDYSTGADGAITFGEPVEVNVDEVVAPKSLVVGERGPEFFVPQKAGARNSATDLEKIQVIHDATVALDAACTEKSLTPEPEAPAEDVPSVGIDAKKRDEYRLLVASTIT